VAISYVVVTSPKPALNERVFSPLIIGGIFLLFSLFQLFTETWPSKKWIQASIIIVLIIILASNIRSSFELVTDLHRNGGLYTNKRWQLSEVMEEVLNLPEDIPLISNVPPPILFYALRPAYEISEITQTIPEENYLPYGEDMVDGVQRVFREERAALILFKEIYWQIAPLYKEDTQARLDAFTEGLYKYYEGWDGAIYYYDNPLE
jgi:hypothetical protein